MRTCEQCLFYVPYEPAGEHLAGASRGDCRRYPPTTQGSTDSYGDGEFWPDWPQTRSDCFCGEFQPQPRT